MALPSKLDYNAMIKEVQSSKIIPAHFFKCTPANPTWRPTSADDTRTLVECDDNAKIIILTAHFMFYDQAFVRDSLFIDTTSVATVPEPFPGDETVPAHHFTHVAAMPRANPKAFTTKDVADLLPMLFESKENSDIVRLIYLKQPILREILDTQAPHVRQMVFDKKELSYSDLFQYMNKTSVFHISQLSESRVWVEVFFSDRELDVYRRQ